MTNNQITKEALDIFQKTYPEMTAQARETIKRIVRNTIRRVRYAEKKVLPVKNKREVLPLGSGRFKVKGK